MFFETLDILGRLILSFIILITGGFFYYYPCEKPFFAFVRLWCLFQSGAVLLNLKEQIRFYGWWRESSLSDSNKRGFGTNGYPLFGFIPMPNLSPSVLLVVSIAYSCLLVLCALFAYQSFVGYLFIGATLLALLYFSSLWAERSASYHREYATLSVLFYLCFTPDFYGLAQASNTIVILVKIHITSIYVAGALQKLACSILAKKPWFTCAPHSFLWRAMWSKPYYPKIQRFLFLQPTLMALGGFFIFFLELLFLLHFWARYEIQLAMVICIILFHATVLVLQGIDYITFWNPVFLLWFLVQGPNLSVLSWPDNLYLVPATVFCAMQLLYAFTFIEDLNINIPPFTCCPMFVNVCSFNERVAQYYCVWDMRSTIAFERLEWIYPFVKVEYGMGMVESDLAKLPFRFIGFGYYVDPHQLPTLQGKWFRKDLIKEEGFFIYANYDVEAQLVTQLTQLANWLHEECHLTTLYDKKFLTEAMKRYENCYNMFVNDVVRDEVLSFNEQKTREYVTSKKRWPNKTKGRIECYGEITRQ